MNEPLLGYRRWTTTEIETLKTMVADGANVEPISDAINRTPDAIRVMCRQLRIKYPKNTKHYRQHIGPCSNYEPSCFKPSWSLCFRKTARQHWLAVRSAITRSERYDIWQRIPPDVYGEVLMIMTTRKK